MYAWSPDQSTLSYLSSNGDKVEWHALSAAGDVRLSDLGSVPGRGVDPNSDDVMIGFSADGKYVALENTFTNSTGAAGEPPPFQVVQLSDHKLVYSRTAGTMATSGSQRCHPLFPHQRRRRVVGPERRNTRGHSAGFKWNHPWPSPDGKLIAYVDAPAPWVITFLVTCASPTSKRFEFPHDRAPTPRF